TWTWHRDSSDPPGTLNSPGVNIRQTVTVTSTETDPPANGYASGLQSVTYEYSANGTTWAPIGTLNSAPFDTILWNTSGVADGVYQLRLVVRDVAGNAATSATVANVRIDNTLPTATIDNPGAYLRGAVNLTSSTGDPGGANASGVVTVAYEYSTNGGGTWQSTGANFNSTAVPDGNVSLHVVATDAAGNTTSSAPITSLADNTKPATTDNAPSGWQSSPVTVTLTANDGGSGVNVTEYSVDGNPTYTTGASVSIPAPADGSND